MMNTHWKYKIGMKVDMFVRIVEMEMGVKMDSKIDMGMEVVTAEKFEPQLNCV